MKKILSLLGAIATVAAGAGSIVSCGNQQGQTTKFKLAEMLKGFKAPNLFVYLENGTERPAPYSAGLIVSQLKQKIVEYIINYLKANKGQHYLFSNDDLTLTYFNGKQEHQNPLLTKILNSQFKPKQYIMVLPFQIRIAPSADLPWISKDHATFNTSFHLDKQFNINSWFNGKEQDNALTVQTNLGLPPYKAQTAVYENKLTKATEGWLAAKLAANSAHRGLVPANLPSDYQSLFSNAIIADHTRVGFGKGQLPLQSVAVLERYLNRNLNITVGAANPTEPQNINAVTFPLIGVLQNSSDMNPIKVTVGSKPILDLSKYTPPTVKVNDIILVDNGERVPQTSQAAVMEEMHRAISQALKTALPSPLREGVSLKPGIDYTVPNFPILLGSVPLTLYQNLQLHSLATSLYLDNNCLKTFDINFKST